MEAAVGRAAAGDLAGAGVLLEDALPRCPDHLGVLRELAAVRFREGRRADAEALARRLLVLDPQLEWGWDLLGTLRYLDDDAVAALRAWNRIGRPRLGAVDVVGPAGAPPSPGTRLRPGSVVTPEDLVRARRRLEAVPTVNRARVSYRPLPGGQVRVEGTVTRHPPHTLTRGVLPAHLARAVGGALRIEAADRAGRGEHITLHGALDRDLREVGLTLALPAPGGAASALDWTANHRVTKLENRRTERTGGRATVRPWPTARTRGSAGFGVDHWPGFGTHAVLEGTAKLDLGRVVALDLGGSWWTGGFGLTEVALGTLVDRSSVPGAREAVGGEGADRLAVGPALRSRTTLTALHGVVPGGTPDDLAPRFGGRRSSTHPMRAAGRVLPPGDAWLHGTVEVTHGWATPTGILVGGALFADAVRGLGSAAGDPGDPGGPGPGTVNLGTGLRLGVPGAQGWLRADWAVDPSTGRSRVSVAWVGRDG
ncbi:MAG: hypothetical protein EA350_09955 [Gemmatimonadales bacterium]|nr:MAG: hypothetical protein EA350_09955 [Gemmatimonadales bacterium]